MGKKYHYFYKITNRKTGEFYYGIHSTDNLDDGYFGSGTRICESVREFGQDTFVKEIVRFFESREKASLFESNVVNSELIQNPKCLSLRTGGDVAGLPGGKISEESLKKKRGTIAKKCLEDPNYKKRIGLKISKSSKGKHKPEGFADKIAKARLGVPRMDLRGVPKSIEHRAKISASLKGRKLSEEHKKHLKQAVRIRTYFHQTEEHKRHVVESRIRNGNNFCSDAKKLAISKARKGRIWVSKELDSGEYIHRVIKPLEQQYWLDRGYKLGVVGIKRNGKRKPCSEETKRKIRETLQNKVWLCKDTEAGVCRKFVTRGSLEKQLLEDGYRYGKK